MIGVQRFTLMAMLPNRMSNVAEAAGRSQERQSKRRTLRFDAEAKNGAEKSLTAAALDFDNAGMV
jgi:hypothetical protein